MFNPWENLRRWLASPASDYLGNMVDFLANENSAEVRAEFTAILEDFRIAVTRENITSLSCEVVFFKYRNSEFRPVATASTFGSGDNFTGREGISPLDVSRYAVGSVS